MKETKPLRDIAVISPFNQVVNLATEPTVPQSSEKFVVIANKKMDSWKFNLKSIGTFQSGRQLHGVTALDILAELTNYDGFNANIIDWLLERKILIPEAWKQFSFGVFASGTMYVDQENQEFFIKGLVWSSQLLDWINVYRPVDKYYYQDSIFLIRKNVPDTAASLLLPNQAN